MPLTTDQAERAVDAHTVARAAITAQAVSFVRSSFTDFDGWYATQKITKLTGDIAKLVESHQRQQASVTNAYLTNVVALSRGRRPKSVARIDVAQLRENITHPGAYGRVADQYRYRVSLGNSEEQAQAIAVARAERIAEMDVSLAFRKQAQQFMQEAGISEWRRVIRPELSLSGTCGLCIVASDRTYYKDDLAALHDRCHCVVLPVGDDDPGEDLNRADLAAIYEQAGSTRAADLKRTRIAVRQHGELGPLLVYRDQDFRGPKQVATDERN